MAKLELSKMLEVGKSVVYYPELTSITGGVTATLLLSYLVHWPGHEEDEDRWGYVTQEELTACLGLSRSEQETARRNLVGRGLLEEKKKGIPCRLWYRVNMENLVDALQKRR